VAEAVPAERLGSAFGASYFVLNLIALLAQLFLVSWLIRSLDVDKLLSLLPALLGVGAVGVAAGGGLVAAFVLKGFDGALRHTLNRTSMELLWVPVEGNLRRRMKPIIDLFGQRSGQIIASLSFLAVTSLTSRWPLILGAAVAGLSAVWIRLAHGLRAHYLALFRQRLSSVTLLPRLELPELGLTSLESLMASLNSPKDDEVVAAVNLLADQDRARLIPALILYHPSSRVVLRALDILCQTEREDYLPLLDHLLASADPELRAAALRVRAATGGEAGDASFLEDPSAGVRATALALAPPDEATVAAIRRLGSSDDSDEQLAVARALEKLPQMRFEELLVDLAGAEEPRVRSATAAAMGALGSPGCLPHLIEMLADAAARDAALAALVEAGEPALDALSTALSASDTPAALRRRLPMAMARFEPRLATQRLGEHLHPGAARSTSAQVVRALLRLHQVDPDLELPADLLDGRIEATVREIFRLIHWQELIHSVDNRASRDSGGSMISDLLRLRSNRAVALLFDLLHLRHPGRELPRIARGLRSSDARTRASSIELLEDLLQPPLRGAVLSIVDDMDLLSKLRHAGPFGDSLFSEARQLLAHLLEEGDRTLRCLAVYRTAEIAGERARDTLRTLENDSDPLVAQVAGECLAGLRASTTGT